MSLYSLSPAVTVKEWDFSQNTPNIPSSKTGAVLRAETGPAFKIVSITNEGDLIGTFGRPTAYNYQDWFQCWNFLQYASSLYVVRPIDGNRLTQNAGMLFSEGSTPATSGTFPNFYNIDVAENQLKTNSDLGSNQKLTFINRFVQSEQKLAIAVCSDATTFETRIDDPYKATFDILAQPLSGATLIAGTKNIKISSGATLKTGSQFLLGATVSASVLYTVVSVTGSDLVVDKNITSAQLSGAIAALPSGTTDLVFTGINLMNEIYSDSLVSRKAYKILDGNLSKLTKIYVETLPTFSRLTEFAPDWTKDEFIVAVLEKDTNGKYGIKEVKMCSYLETGKDVQGRNNFAEELFFNTSTSLYRKVGVSGEKVNSTVTTFASLFTSTDVTAHNGAQEKLVYPYKTDASTRKYVYDGYAYDKGDIQEAQELFSDPESFDVNILISHPYDINGMAQIAETRKDCIAVVAPFDDYGNDGNGAADISYLITNGNSDCTDYLLESWGTQTQGVKTFNAFSTYAAIYANAKYQYDKFNDVNRWISLVGDVAGIYAQVDATRDPWWAPAGGERGKIKNTIKLAFNPNKQNRDDLYVNGLNPVISIPGEGAGIIFGQKTATDTSSAIDRVNVRRLLLFIEKSISIAARSALFEFNDSFTRTRLFGQIDPFLRTVQTRRGLYEYLLVCDSSNNTSEVIDQNALVIDVYVKPVKVAEFIAINMIVTKTGTSFGEVVGKFGG